METKEAIYGGEVGWIDDQILMHVINDNGLTDENAPKGLERTKYNVDRMGELMGEIKTCLMTDIRQLKGSIPKASRDYSQKVFKGKVIAFAVIVQSGVSKIFGNILMGFNKADAPMKLFTNVDKAVNWLQEQRDSQEA